MTHGLFGERIVKELRKEQFFPCLSLDFFWSRHRNDN